MSYVMGKKMEEKGGFRFDKGEDESLWGRLKEVFESTYEVLHELAEERGIKVEDIYEAENIDREFWGEDFESHLKGEQAHARVEESDIIRITMIYEDVADKCLEKFYDLMDEKQCEEKARPVEDAVDTINWYLDLIQAKMRRALYSYYFHRKAEKEEYNGSAKVALIAIDRSGESWGLLADVCPELRKEIGHVQVILEQLRIDIERQFSEARDFQRPGFEKLPE